MRLSQSCFVNHIEIFNYLSLVAPFSLNCELARTILNVTTSLYLPAVLVFQYDCGQHFCFHHPSVQRPCFHRSIPCFHRSYKSPSHRYRKVQHVPEIINENKSYELYQCRLFCCFFITILGSS